MNGSYPEVPESFSEWLLQEKGALLSSVKVYVHNMQHFLGFMTTYSPENAPSLNDVWDYQAFKAFSKALGEAVAPSTVMSYYNSLTNVRTFLKCRGEAPEDYDIRETSFKVLANNAIKKRTKYIKASKAKKTAQPMAFSTIVFITTQNFGPGTTTSSGELRMKVIFQQRKS